MITYKTDLKGITVDRIKGFCNKWKYPLKPEQLIQILKNSFKFVLAVDCDNDNVVGFVNALSDQIHFAFIPMLEVLPVYQHRGIGTKLMESLLKGLEHIACIDLTCDPNLQPFYEKFKMLRSHGMVIRRYLSH